MPPKFNKIEDRPKDKFMKIWRTLWFVRVYNAIVREFSENKDYSIKSYESNNPNLTWEERKKIIEDSYKIGGFSK